MTKYEYKITICKMKFIYLITITMLEPVLLSAQKSDYDCIYAHDYYILKTDSVNKSYFRISVSQLKNINQAQLLFGVQTTTNSYHDLLFEENFTDLNYIDGLKLRFSDTNKDLFTFKVFSANYTMLLLNGRQIRTGMTADELAKIFPKSFAKREDYLTPDPRHGKASLKVYFCFIKDNEIQFTDTWLIFILNERNGILEEFFSFVPG